MLSPAHFSAAESILGTFQNSQIGKVIPGKTFVQIWPEAWSILGHSRISECPMLQKYLTLSSRAIMLLSPAHFPAAEALLEKLIPRRTSVQIWSPVYVWEFSG